MLNTYTVLVLLVSLIVFYVFSYPTCMCIIYFRLYYLYMLLCRICEYGALLFRFLGYVRKLAMNDNRARVYIMSDEGWITHYNPLHVFGFVCGVTIVRMIDADDECWTDKPQDVTCPTCREHPDVRGDWSTIEDKIAAQ